MSFEDAILKHAEALNNLAAALQNLNIEIPTAPAIPEKSNVADLETERKTRKPRKTAKKAEPEVEVEVEVEAEPVMVIPDNEDDPFGPDEAPATSKYTIDQCRNALTAVSNTKGREVALAILKGLGAQKLTELDPSKYGDLIAQCADAA